MAAGDTDRWASIATVQTTESAAGTITFSSINTGVGLATKRGLLIDELQFFVGLTDLNLILAETDAIDMGLTVSNGVDDLSDFTDRRILQNLTLSRADHGTAASGELVQMPIIQQFFPALITAEQTLYFGVKGISLAAVFTAKLRILFRYIELSDRDVLEIAQNFSLVS